jgi:hypothetical protein
MLYQLFAESMLFSSSFVLYNTNCKFLGMSTEGTCKSCSNFPSPKPLKLCWYAQVLWLSPLVWFLHGYLSTRKEGCLCWQVLLMLGFARPWWDKVPLVQPWKWTGFHQPWLFWLKGDQHMHIAVRATLQPKRTEGQGQSPRLPGYLLSLLSTLGRG